MLSLHILLGREVEKMNELDFGFELQKQLKTIHGRNG